MHRLCELNLKNGHDDDEWVKNCMTEEWIGVRQNR